MLRLAVIFLVIALTSASLGLSGIWAISLWSAKLLFFVFLVLSVLALMGGRMGRANP